MNAIERLGATREWLEDYPCRGDEADWIGGVIREYDDAVAAVDDLYQAAEAWAYERRRWIDGEAPDRAAMQDAEAGLVAAVRRIEEGA